MICTVYIPDRTAEPVRRTLIYLASVAPWLRQGQIEIRVYRIRRVDATNPRVLAALRTRGVTSLPALFSNGRPFVGATAIYRFCESALKVVAPPAAATRRPTPTQRTFASFAASHSQPPRRQFESIESDGGGSGSNGGGSGGGNDGDSEDLAATDLHEYLRQEISGGGRDEEDLGLSDESM